MAKLLHSSKYHLTHFGGHIVTRPRPTAKFHFWSEMPKNRQVVSKQTECITDFVWKECEVNQNTCQTLLTRWEAVPKTVTAIELLLSLANHVHECARLKLRVCEFCLYMTKCEVTCPPLVRRCQIYSREFWSLLLKSDSSASQFCLWFLCFFFSPSFIIVNLTRG